MNGHPGDSPVARESSGESALTNQPLGEVYDELRELARQYLTRQRWDHTLQPSAAAQEAYLRLIKRTPSKGVDPAHFYWTVARAIRSVLVEHARRRGAGQQNTSDASVPLNDAVTFYDDRAIDLLALDEALDRLNAIDPRMMHIIDLRFFGGLSEEAVAAALGLSLRSVRREWRTARAWLHGQLSKRRPHDA